MIQRIIIQNLALISSVELEFGEGLNVLSGETGAGKSIIVDAIMLLLGSKYDKNLLSYGAEKGFVQGVFSVSPRACIVLDEFGIDYEDEIIVVRRFNAEGKSDVRVNGKVVSIGMLKEITSSLMDIYGQQEYQTIAKTSEQRRILDYYVRHKLQPLSDIISKFLKELDEINNSLTQIGDENERVSTIDLLRFQVAEIKESNISRDEEKELLDMRKRISASEKIKDAIILALNSMESEHSAADLLQQSENALASISGYDENFMLLKERISSLIIELDDIAASLKDQAEENEFDENALENCESRLETLRRLKRKYGDYDDMIAYLEDAEKKLNFLENSDEVFLRLNKEKNSLLHKIYDVATQMHEIRFEGAQGLKTVIENELKQLSMPAAKFDILFSELPDFEETEQKIHNYGFDEIEFMFSANEGQPLKPMIKVISGGEMSRFMLALKTVNGDAEMIPTMIFDEIDTGISGLTGQAVAKKLAEIAIDRQVLCVTHLSQLAAMADNHFYIEKKSENGETFTSVMPLDRDGMIKEIARLSGGYGISANSLIGAQEMKQWSDGYKDSLKSSCKNK